MTFKPYIKKPLIHSSRGEEVLANIKGYLIKINRTVGTIVDINEARINDPGQCIAALRAARQANLRCLVYAIADVLGEECLELVDEDFLLRRVQ